MKLHMFLLAAFAWTAACDSSTAPSPPAVVNIAALTAIEVTGVVGTAITPAPAVRATDANGRPVRRAQIRFVGGVRDGVIANGLIQTDSNGIATAGQWTLGTTAGIQTVSVFFGDEIRVRFTALATPGPVAQLTRLSGHGIAPAGGPLKPILVHVADAFGNFIAGALVRFTVTAGAGRIADSVVTSNAAGIAVSGTWTLGPEAGVQQVRAESGAAHVLVWAYAFRSPWELLFVRHWQIYKTDSSGREVGLTFGETDFQPAWSPDGSRIAFVRGANIFLMDPDGSAIRQLTFLPDDDRYNAGLHSPAWSPDGRTLAVATGGVYEGEVYLLKVDDHPASLLQIATMAAQPAWSPDGKKIVFVSLSGDDGYHELQVMNADGTGIKALTIRDSEAIYHPSWSPDGGRIAFSKCFGGGCEVYVIAADGSATTQLKHLATGRDPAWSSDGNLIAFSLGNWPGSIAVIPAAGGDPFTLVTDGFSAAWRP